MRNFKFCWCDFYRQEIKSSPCKHYLFCVCCRAFISLFSQEINTLVESEASDVGCEAFVKVTLLHRVMELNIEEI